MKAILSTLPVLLFLLLLPATAQETTPDARADWEEYLQQIKQAAEGYLRDATHGNGDLQVNQVGYLQARRYYQHALLLAPGDPGALASQRVVDEQLARFRCQRRWQLFKSVVVNSFYGSPATRRLNDGKSLGLGRATFDVEATSPAIEQLIPSEQWTLRYSRRRVPFLLQMQVGLGVEESGIGEGEFEDLLDETAYEADLIAGHAAVEIGYTVLPTLRYLLPYLGIGYRGMLGYYDDSSGGGDYLLHGTYLRFGCVLSLGRTVKVALDYGRSLEIYGSEFDSSGLIGEDCSDCFDSWNSRQISVEFLF